MQSQNGRDTHPGEAPAAFCHPPRERVAGVGGPAPLLAQLDATSPPSHSVSLWADINIGPMAYLKTPTAPQSFPLDQSPKLP